MNEERDIEGMPDAQPNQYARLAHWIQQVMQQPDAAPSSLATTQDNAEELLDLQFDSQYHLRYYRQLPNFALALLNNEPQATLHYAALLYHLAGCDVCRHAYIDIYSSLKEALQPSGPRPFLGQGTRTLNATPPRMLNHLCRTLISQAEAVLLQERHEHVIPSDWDNQNKEEEARVLLRLALRMGAHIIQQNVRRQALQDLVRVASIAEGWQPVQPNDPEARSYTPALAGTTKTRGKVFRRADMLQPPQHGAQATFTIPLQSHNLNGTIVQHGNQLELHLKDLDVAMRGHHVRVSVLLGSLIEPVRWYGRDPHAILSPTPVADDGSLIIPLGETDLQLSNSEDYQLLETLFMLVDVRKA